MNRMIILIALVVGFIARPGQAADIHVNAAAAGGGNGSIAAPYNNIAAALTQAAAAGADTVKIAEGTYNEGLRLTIPADTTLQGSNNTLFTTRSTIPTSTISRVIGSTSHGLLLVDAVNGVVVDGLVLENGHTQEGAGQAGRGGGLRAVGGVGVTVNNCIFRNCRAPGDYTGNTDAVFADDGAAVYSDGTGASMTIVKTIFEDCYAENEGIVRADDGTLIIEQCTFRRNEANSSMIRARDASVTRLEVRNSLFYANESPTALIYSNASQEATLHNNTITSNTLTDDGDGVIHIENEGVATLSIQNNLIANNTTVGDPPQDVLTADGALTGTATITNNLLFSNDPMPAPGLGITLGANGNIGSDPLFVDPSNHDYHLQPGSPAQNAGIAIAEITVDLDGNARNGLPDIGAFELPPAVNAAHGWTWFN